MCPRGAAAATRRSLCGRPWSQATVAVDPSAAAGAEAANPWLSRGAAAAAVDEATATATATASCLATVAVTQRRQRACTGEQQPRPVCHRLSPPSPSQQPQPPAPSPIAFDHGTGWPSCARVPRLVAKAGGSGGAKRSDTFPVAMVAQSQAGAPLYLRPPPLAVSTDIFKGGHGAHRCTEANSAAPL